MADRVIHISEAEAASNFAGVLARVREGAEVVIENGKLPVAVLRPAKPHVRLLSGLCGSRKNMLPRPPSTEISLAIWKPLSTAIVSR
jgi:antitoxin (DNA-binding transcriptional repressor) of toxin-antitoxin stability system